MAVTNGELYESLVVLSQQLEKIGRQVYALRSLVRSEPDRVGNELANLIRTEFRTLRTEMKEQHMSLRDDFDADETRVEQEIQQVVSILTNLPSSVDQLTQADLDRVKAQGDALAAALPSTGGDTPTPEPTPVDPTGV